MPVKSPKIKIFKIKNRKGYAAVCQNNLTEGSTVLQAYQRMGKALKRNGITLKELNAASVKKLLALSM
jgi:hypothetical protein